ncbi:sulfite exporter TauE/SafE family protein [Wukongibacter baidiensis]|uniref:sulfite exporter TauE/SafE family protein n=1 Tax=Wukongibacter baidiensis TaxID=1723361 RepID=UPI003D7FA32C
MENQLAIVIIGFIVILCSGIIQGATSFGFSLLALPILGAFIPLKMIVPMLVIYSLIMNSIILYKIREHVKLKRMTLLIVSAVIATPIGANMLINLNETFLKIGVGVIVTISALSFYFGYKFKIKNEKIAYIPVGFMSGLLNGSVSLSGPPVILFLANQDVEKQVFRATLTAYFWLLNIMTLITFIYKKLIDVEVLRITGYLLPALIIGVLIGIKLGNKIKEETFKKLTTVLMIFMGALSIVSGIK